MAAILCLFDSGHCNFVLFSGGSDEFLDVDFVIFLSISCDFIGHKFCEAWEALVKSTGAGKILDLHSDDIKGIAEKGMKAWEQMQSGAIELIRKYAVQTCGYCSEVQVRPKGHIVRQCQAFKHQMRDGQHAWQEATIDDLVPPEYVWHVQDHQAGALVDALKRYYGKLPVVRKLPAVVELFAQAGARVGDSYTGVTREDIVVPALDEEQLVV